MSSKSLGDQNLNENMYFMNCNSSISTIACDRDCKLLAIGGRDCKKK